MKFRILLLATTLILSASCSRKLLIQEAYAIEASDESRRDLSNNRVDIRTSFAGDNGYSFITFQIDVDNKSSETIYFDENDVTLIIGRGADKQLLSSIPKREIISMLEYESKNVNLNKKVDTAEGALGSGFELLAGILAGDIIGGIFYGSLTAADMLTRRNDFKKAERSIEEELAYHEEYTLDEATLAPGESGSYDIHFDRTMQASFAYLEIYCADHNYGFEYQLEVKEIKVK